MVKKIAIIAFWIAENGENKPNEYLEDAIREELIKTALPLMGKLDKVTVLEASEEKSSQSPSEAP